MGKCGAEEIVPSAAAGLRDLSSVSAAFPSRLSLPSFHEAVSYTHLTLPTILRV